MTENRFRSLLNPKAIFPVAVFAALSVLAVALPVAGQGKRPMTLVDLLEVPSLGDPQLSPDGRQLLYVVSEVGWQANRHRSHVWRVNVDGTGAVQMIARDGESSPRWSPDGTLIAFIGRRGDAKGPQIYLMRRDGEEAQPLTDHETSIPDLPGIARPGFQSQD